MEVGQKKGKVRGRRVEKSQRGIIGCVVREIMKAQREECKECLEKK